MEDCLFCKIIKGDIPSKKVYEDASCYAFMDIAPQAPVHVVLVPKTHITGMNEIDKLPPDAIAALMHAITVIAQQENIANSGYRVVSNCGADACQSVQHLHLHILGGTPMADKMA